MLNETFSVIFKHCDNSWPVWHHYVNGTTYDPCFFKAISGWTTRRLLRHHDTMLLHINTVLILMASFYRVGKIVPPLMIQVSCRTVKQMFSPAFSLVWLISFRALSLDKWFVLIPWCPKFHGSKALYVSNIYDFGYLLALIQPFWFISVW